MVNYARKHNLRAQDLSASQQMLSKYLPTLAEISPKWASVSSSNFRINQHAAHRSFYDTVRYLIRNQDRLDALIDKKRDDDRKSGHKKNHDSEHSQKASDKSSTPLYGSEIDHQCDGEQSQDHQSDVPLSIPGKPRRSKILGKRKANHVSRYLNSVP